MTLGQSPAEIVEQAENTGSAGLLAKHSSWARVPLGLLSRIVNGAAFSSEEFNVEGMGLPLVRVRDLSIMDPQTYCTSSYTPEHLVHKGDTLVGMDGDFRVAHWDGPTSLLNQRVCRIELRGTEWVEIGWLHYILPGYLNAIWEKTSSVTVKHLSSRSLEQLPFPVPPKNEQVRIVEALDGYFARLHRASRSIAEATVRGESILARTVLERLHVDPSSETLPAGWHWSTVAQLSFESSYGTSTKCSHDGPGPPVLRIPNIRAGRIDKSDLKFAVDPAQELSRYYVRKGDLLCVRTNGSPSLIGRTAVVKQDDTVAYASYLIRFRFSTLMTAEWVQLVLGSPRWRSYIVSGAATSAGQYNLNSKYLGSTRIPVPPAETQRKILDEATGLTRDMIRLNQSISKARSAACLLSNRMLQQAARGELVDQDPSDEPADVLLARIRAEHDAATTTDRTNRRPRTRKATVS